MKKILVCLPSLTNGDGIANFYMNYYDNLISNNYIIDFLCVSHDDYSQEILNKVKKNSTIFVIPLNNKINRVSIVKKYLKEFFLNSDYEIIHVNLIDLYAATINCFFKKEKKIVILHAHNPVFRDNSIKSKVKNIFHKLAIKNCNCRLACSTLAGDNYFNSKDYIVIPNKIDVPKFKYSNEDRNIIRKMLGVSDNTLLIGTIGRMTEQKNPFFLLSIILELENKLDYKVLWIGNGPLESDIKNVISSNQLEHKFIFISSTSEIYKYYSSMDLFLLPSLYEGLGIVFIEAQSNGLKCLTSNKVPTDIIVSDLVIMYDLNKDIQKWSKKIIETKTNKYDRSKYNCLIQKSIFSKQNNNELLNIYENLIKGARK